MTKYIINNCSIRYKIHIYVTQTSDAYIYMTSDTYNDMILYTQTYAEGYDIKYKIVITSNVLTDKTLYTLTDSKIHSQ